MIKKEGKKFVLYSQDGKRKLGVFDSRAEAVKHEARIRYFKRK